MKRKCVAAVRGAALALRVQCPRDTLVVPPSPLVAAARTVLMLVGIPQNLLFEGTEGRGHDSFRGEGIPIAYCPWKE